MAKTNSDLVGALAYWTGLDGVRLPRAEFRAEVTAVGLKDALAAIPSAEKILNRAVGAANRRQSGDVTNKTKTGYARLKEKTDAVATYAVLMRRDVGNRMSYIEEATLSIDRTQPAPVPTVVVEHGAPADDERAELVKHIVDEYTDQLNNADTHEVSETLVRAIRDVCSGLTLRMGVYAVTPAYVEPLARLAAYLERVSVSLTVWEINSSSRNRANASKDARKSLRTTFDELMADVADFRAAHPKADEVAVKSVTSRVRRFKDLDAKVSLYADIVGDYAEQLRAGIDAAKRDLEACYLDDVGATEAAA